MKYKFVYLSPADAEVISIDALVKEPKGVVIGVTLVKTDSEPKAFYLNLYGVHCDSTAPFKWENIAGTSHQLFARMAANAGVHNSSHIIIIVVPCNNYTDDWQPLELKFIPFQLTHTE